MKDIQNKIVSLKKIMTIRKKIKKAGLSLVFTNGCFDIIHPGHIFTLHQAKQQGDILCVGLNSDTSVKRNKSSMRPINTQYDRALVLAALKMVDYVIIFNEKTPYRIISKLKPDVLVKGSDWKKVSGKRIVEANGGRVISSRIIKGYSTSSIISKILTRYVGATSL